MGIQVRKRTKGKSSWWNGSYSKKGAGVSGSVKVGNVTFNTGDLLNGKTSSRTTVDLGNGIRYVSYGKKNSISTSAKNPYPDKFSAFVGLIIWGSALIFIIIMALAMLAAAFF